MNPFPWLNVEFKANPPRAEGFSLAVWVWWALRLLALFAVMRMLSELV